MIDATRNAGDLCKLVADDAGDLHVAYFARTSLQVRYAHKAKGSGWGIPEALEQATDTMVPSLAVDGTGNVHVAYFDGTNGDLKYTVKKAGKWAQPIALDTEGDVGYSPSIAVDSQGDVHIAYIDGTLDTVKHAHKSVGCNWTLTNTGAMNVRTLSMGFGQASDIHIVLVDSLTEKIRYIQSACSL